MILNTYIQSGELDTILGDKLKVKFIKSLRFRIILLVAVAGMIPCIVMRMGILESYERRAVDVRTAEIQNQCTILCNQLSSTSYLADPTSENINAELMQLSNVYNGRIMVINQEFQIVKDTYGFEEGKTIVSEDVVKCYKGTGTQNYDAKNKYIEITHPISENGSNQVEGMMLMSVSTDSIVDNLGVLKKKAVALQAMVILIVLVLGSAIATLMVRPFAKITKEIEDITEGYDSDTLHENGYTEMVLISEAVNKMLARLKVLDDSREEFVSNVSHELKTPLTSMKVLADSLLAQEGAPLELYQEFMGDITQEIERENKIINDLLSLVKMDKTAADLNIKPVNINDLLELILKRLRPIAAIHNIEVVFESFRPVTADIDEVKLTLAISNLVENAIKYNIPEGWVHVSLNADHKYFYIKVADSGIGIPETAVEHIFERFYRVDKSHSKDIGGTGLGLSITRNAVVMHRGAVKVYSKEGEGTTFTVRVPLNYTM
ncbi:MAG: HAMP domain-containing sensor histidine kinase [Lachnospiraceae bacterium]